MQGTKETKDRSRLLGDMIQRLPEDKYRVELLEILSRQESPIDIRKIFELLHVNPDYGSHVLEAAGNDRLIEIQEIGGAYVARLTPFGQDVLHSLRSASAA